MVYFASVLQQNPGSVGPVALGLWYSKTTHIRPRK